jgi:signal transduction histidine kinase/CheY-like chemotaxis protein/HPt (histidine-containing phosphotransfer) domain-containing protein
VIAAERTWKKMKLMPTTLKSKLLAMSIVITGTALISTSVALLAYDYVAFRHRLIENAQTDAGIVAGNCTAALSFDDEKDATQTLASLRAERRIVGACVYGLDQRPMATYFRDNPVQVLSPNALPPGQYRFAADSLDVAAPIQLNGRRIGSVFLTFDLTDLHTRTRESASLFAIAILSAMGIALAMAWRFTGSILRPVADLIRTTRLVSVERNYGVRAARTSDDELGALVDGVNAMLDQIQHRDAELRTHRDHLEELVAARTVELSAARDRAEESNRAKSAFLANMSHEIRTPMTAILGYADLMLSPQQTMSDRINSLQVVQRNARHLMDLINDILDISKIEAEKMTVERIPHDVAQTAVEVASMLRPRALAKNLALRVEFNGEIPAHVFTDPVRLKQVLMNLVGNAVKFTAQGEVVIAVSAQRVEQPDGPHMQVRFDISDTGIGITPQQIGSLFQAFVQADDSMTRKYGGTGLGLVISKRLTECMGGQLSVRSVPGSGSVFSMWIDGGAPDAAAMRVGLSESMFSLGTPDEGLDLIELQGRILLVEDGIDNQHLLSIHLSSAGAEVTLAQNGREAIEQVAQHPFDLILMDMQMPEVDGYTATAELRRQGNRLPIIALTAHAMSGDRARCIAAGCTDYLTKPIERDLLLRTVASHLNAAREAHLQIDAAANHSLTPAPTPPAASSAQLAYHQPLLSPQSTQPARSVAAAATPAAAGKPGAKAAAVAAAMQRAVDGFLGRLPARIAALTSLVEADDLGEIQRLAHQLKGAGTSYGFPAITLTAARLEASAKAADQCDAIRSQVNELVQLLQSTALNQHPRERHA